MNYESIVSQAINIALAGGVNPDPDKWAATFQSYGMTPDKIRAMVADRNSRVSPEGELHQFAGEVDGK